MPRCWWIFPQLGKSKLVYDLAETVDFSGFQPVPAFGTALETDWA
jgi:hypothetical protein